eukprot:scaffold125518_cov47-Prasinocladus_malaysianus.AAC.2
MMWVKPCTVAELTSWRSTEVCRGRLEAFGSGRGCGCCCCCCWDESSPPSHSSVSLYWYLGHSEARSECRLYQWIDGISSALTDNN